MSIWVKLRLKLIKYNYKRIIKSIGSILLVEFTALQLLEGIARNLFDINIDKSISAFIYPYIIVGIVVLLIEMKAILSNKYKIDDGITIEIAIGDYIKNMELYEDTICVFGVDDRFIMDHSLAVKNSIYYDFLKKYYTKDKENIQSEVDEYILKNYNIDNRHLKGLERKQIPHGKIVNLELKNPSSNGSEFRNFIMISAAEVYKSRGAKMKDLTVNYPLEIWKFIDCNKLQERSILFPLIGTSTARAFKHNDIAKQLVDMFFENLEQNNIKRFIISIKDEDYINGDVDINELSKYIESKIIIYKSKHSLNFNY